MYTPRSRSGAMFIRRFYRFRAARLRPVWNDNGRSGGAKERSLMRNAIMYRSLCDRVGTCGEFCPGTPKQEMKNRLLIPSFTADGQRRGRRNSAGSRDGAFLNVWRLTRTSWTARTPASNCSENRDFREKSPVENTANRSRSRGSMAQRWLRWLRTDPSQV